MFVLLKILVAALLCARWLVPTEAAAQGTTLWLAQLWPVALGLWAWSALRTPGVRIRWGMCDTLLALVVAGHVISATAVLMTEGQKRSAVNMLWEWIGLGIGFFLLRQLIVTRVDRDRLLLAFVAVMVSLSGLGIWQHFVFYPQSRVQYEQTRSRLDGLLNGSVSPRPSRVAEQQRRIRRATNELLQMGVLPEAMSGRMRQAFESRLQASSEPFGPFALANTFAGFLAMGLVLLVAAGRNFWRLSRGSFVRQGGLISVMVLVAFCLLLTKSRTAWVGTACGLCSIGIVNLWRWKFSSREQNANRQSVRRGAFVLLGGGVLLSGLLIVAASSGGLDDAVLSEAPKSLAYRLEYWTGSWAVVRKHPWLGVGPGNFRQHYLQHKLPGSSEEIADPHNVLLGIWTSGGLMAVCGLIGLLAAWVSALWRSQLWKPQQDDKAVRPKRMPAEERFSPWLWGTGFGFVLVLAFLAVVENRFDEGLFLLLLGWLAVLAVFRGRLFSVSSVGVGAAVLAVMVHLLGAGGVEMPAVVQIIFMLLAVGLSGIGCSDAEGSDVDASDANRKKTIGREESNVWKSRLSATAVGMVAVIVFVSCLLTATRPVLDSQALMRLGDASMLQGNRLAAARRFYLAAAVADPLSPEPVDRLAELEFQMWKRGGSSAGDFSRVVKFSEQTIRLDPANWMPYRALGNRYQSAFRQTNSSSDAAAAVKSLGQALDHYPNNALLQAELAEACFNADDNSRAHLHAERAIQLNHLNQSRGHRDRLLSEETRKILKKILEPAE